MDSNSMPQTHCQGQPKPFFKKTQNKILDLNSNLNSGLNSNSNFPALMTRLKKCKQRNVNKQNFNT